MNVARKLRGEPPLVITEKQSPSSVISLAIDSGCSHICQKDGHAFDKEVESASKLLDCPENLISYPIATILSPSDLSSESERLLLGVEHIYDHSNQKHDVLTSFTNAMESKGIPKTTIDDSVCVADELFTNSIYNAPFVDPLTHKNPGMNRMGEVKLPDGKFNRIFLAHDECRLLVGCHDPFGTLELVTFLEKIKATYQKGAAATMNFGAGGAGLGSYIIFNAGASLYFGVWPGRATVLCCVIPLGLSNRRRAELVKHFHWIKR